MDHCQYSVSLSWRIAREQGGVLVENRRELIHWKMKPRLVPPRRTRLPREGLNIGIRTGEMARVGDGTAMIGNVHSPHIRGEASFRTNRILEGLAELQRLWIILESDSTSGGDRIAGDQVKISRVESLWKRSIGPSERSEEPPPIAGFPIQHRRNRAPPAGRTPVASSAKLSQSASQLAHSNSPLIETSVTLQEIQCPHSK